MARRFNLQAWRAAQREQVRKQFFVITGVVAVAVAAVCGGIYFAKNKYIETQQNAISLLDREISSLQSTQREVDQTKKLNEEILRQIVVIQGLQLQRSLSLEILDYFAQHTPPDTVFINRMTYANNRLELEGVAENELGVTEFIRTLENFQHFSAVELQYLRTATSNNRYQVMPRTSVQDFRLVITVVPDYLSQQLSQ